MGIMGLIQEAKLKIRQAQYSRALKKEAEMEMSKNRLKQLAKEEDHYKRLQRIEQKKANINRLKATPLKRIAGVLQKQEVQELKKDSPFAMSGNKEDSPFGFGKSKDNPFVK